MATSWRDPSGQGRGDTARKSDEAEIGFSESDEARNSEAHHTITLEDVLHTMGETAYRWDMQRDLISWAENAATVLDVPDLKKLNSGRAFGLHVDAEHAGPRFEALTGGPKRTANSEIRYRTQYRFLPDGRRGSKARWLEEIGRCRIGPDGKPARVEGTIRVIDDWSEKEQRLEFLGSHDELTGQLNRTGLTERLAEMLSSAGPKHDGALLLVAVNDLTLINETYGFDIGDQIIAMVGRRLSRALRGKDCVGRFASNKFGILLHNCPGKGVSVIARRLMSLVGDRPFETGAGGITAGVSVGAVKLPEHATNAQLATGRALQALEAARTNHNDRFMLYQRSERRESERRRAASTADEIVRALNDRRMVLAIQPIVKAKSREIVAYETLLRMHKPDGSIQPAGEFMPVAEKFGLSKLVDARVLELVGELLRMKPTVKFCVNVSPTVSGDRDWLTGLQALANVDRRLPERLIVEINETAAISKLEEMTNFIAEVRRLGTQVALDGFGTGYSSFRHLEGLGIDLVKIDSSFIENVTARVQDGYFVRTLVDLAANLGIATVGEGVGDEATAEALERAGIAFMQGYFFGGPEIAPNVSNSIGRIDLA
ncbi:EAL domain-containing protein [Methyloligella solikamskensis]|uniref:EAL domain-containing protein n=1 Tax=Methyloligella solikamskensis TaxID=1177756 RepID=A0ABW3J6Y5_9HYPH